MSWGVITVALAVCLLFGRRSERAIRALWDQLESLGVPSLRSHTHGRHVPHLSYAVAAAARSAAALPDPPQRTAPQRQDATLSPARSHTARELRGGAIIAGTIRRAIPVLREPGQRSCAL